MTAVTLCSFPTLHLFVIPLFLSLRHKISEKNFYPTKIFELYRMYETFNHRSKWIKEEGDCLCTCLYASFGSLKSDWGEMRPPSSITPVTDCCLSGGGLQLCCCLTPRLLKVSPLVSSLFPFSLMTYGIAWSISPCVHVSFTDYHTAVSISEPCLLLVCAVSYVAVS